MNECITFRNTFEGFNAPEAYQDEDFGTVLRIA